MKIWNYMLMCVVVLCTSCASSKKVVYLQDVVPLKQQDIEQKYEVYVHNDDLLAIMVNSKNPELALPFNMPMVSYQLGSGSTNSGSQRVLGYLVDGNGDIDFPILGKLHVAGLTRMQLTELYRESDIISLHCPLTDQTKYMIDKDSIDKMKEGVMIINTGRGQLINTNDLIEGLKEKKIAAAGLDVYEEEGEYFYEDKSDKIIDDDVLARLLSFNNVIVTSHQAFFTKEALHNIAETTLQNIEDFRCHRPLVNEVIL